MAERHPTAMVVGAGIAGLACALALSRRFAVTVVDAGETSNASRVAAGMLAPAAEAATDPLAPPLPLMQHAAALWPAFAEGVGAGEALHACGTLKLGDDPAPAGDGWRRVSADEAQRLQPALAPGGGDGWFAEADLRVDVAAMLDRLAGALRARGVGRLRRRVTSVGPGAVQLADGSRLAADLVVAAAGAGLRRFVEDVPEAALLEPIKGQLVRYAPATSPHGGAMVRAARGYLCPSAEGAVFGATMEPGVEDARVDPEAVARLAEAARALCPDLSGGIGAAGVRVATADGLPMVGWSESGVLVAAGFRRNGWLLAPLAAEMVAAYADEADPGDWAEALAPGRGFSPARR